MFMPQFKINRSNKPSQGLKESAPLFFFFAWKRPFFLLPFLKAIFIEHKGSFFHVAPVSSLHHRSAVEQASSVTRASSIVVVVEVAKPPPLSSLNPACRLCFSFFKSQNSPMGFERRCVCRSRDLAHDGQSWDVSRFPFRYGGEERLFCVTDKMNEGVVKLFPRDAVVEDGCDDTLASFKV